MPDDTTEPSRPRESAAPLPTEQPARRARIRRRVTTEAVPGTDPTPTPSPEPTRHAENENDDRLKADKPPHWG